jgi:sec-independent protein translocase protein TatA
MFGLGPTEYIVIALIVLLLFGNRLPSAMRSLGRGVVEFKKGIQGIEDDIKNSSDKTTVDYREAAKSKIEHKEESAQK